MFFLVTYNFTPLYCKMMHAILNMWVLYQISICILGNGELLYSFPIYLFLTSYMSMLSGDEGIDVGYSTSGASVTSVSDSSLNSAEAAVNDKNAQDSLKTVSNSRSICLISCFMSCYSNLKSVIIIIIMSMYSSGSYFIVNTST